MRVSLKPSRIPLPLIIAGPKQNIKKLEPIIYTIARSSPAVPKAKVTKGKPILPLLGNMTIAVIARLIGVVSFNTLLTSPTVR